MIYSTDIIRSFTPLTPSPALEYRHKLLISRIMAVVYFGTKAVEIGMADYCGESFKLEQL